MDLSVVIPIFNEEQSLDPLYRSLRPGKTRSGVEARTILKHVIGHIRRHWPKVHILVRGDSR